MEKHLRVRGENFKSSQAVCINSETPPRTRRKHGGLKMENESTRNTSAYAEKTNKNRTFTDFGKKHLRVRGENKFYADTAKHVLETPPRTRRKLFISRFGKSLQRNTSAYAEKTLLSARRNAFIWKHLRVRGENGTWSERHA